MRARLCTASYVVRHDPNVNPDITQCQGRLDYFPPVCDCGYMTTPYAGQDIWAEYIEHVTDDDVRDGSVYAISAISLADRTIYLKNRGFYSTPSFGGTYTNVGTFRLTGSIILTNTGGIAITYASAHGYARTANLHAYANPMIWDLAFNFAPPKGYYVQINLEAGASNSGLVFDFDLPSNCTITRVAVRVSPTPTHLAVPDLKPTIFAYLVDVVAGTTTLIGTIEDPTVVLTDYNALHVVSLTLNQAFDASRHRLMVKIFGEDDDANPGLAVLGLIVNLPIVEFTRAQIGEEFGELLP
jgi:hypothetical protein